MKKMDKFMNHVQVIAGVASVAILGIIVAVTVALGVDSGGLPLGSFRQ